MDVGPVRRQKAVGREKDQNKVDIIQISLYSRNVEGESNAGLSGEDNL